MSNLFSKASIIITPTAYSEGLIHSVKPIQTFGSELVTNGDFSTDSDFTKTENGASTITISGGRANFNVVAGGYVKLTQAITYTSGKVYLLKAIVNGTDGKQMRFRDDISNSGGLNTNNGKVLMNGTDQSIKIRFTANSNSDEIAIERQDNATDDNYSFTVKNVSIKEVDDETDGDLEFTRATTATRVNPNNIIELVNDNIPRIDFVSGSLNNHLLLEPESTNLEVASAALTTGWGINTGASQQVETGITPFGVSGNIKRLSGATNSPPNWTDGANSLKKQYTVTATDPASTFTFSVYVKSAGSSTVNIQLRNNTAGPSNTTGAITLSSDWQRVSVTLAVTTTTTKIGVVIAGTDGDILLSGAQLEAKEFATSLIPTDGTTVTRNADAASNAGNSDLINSTEGVLYAEIAALADDQTNRAITLSDGTTDNIVQIFFASGESNKIRYIIRSGGVGGGNLDFSSTANNITNYNKIALKYKLNDAQAWINGSKLSTDTSTNVPVSLSRLDLLYSGIGNTFYGKAKVVAVFKEALSDEELECLTTI